MKVGFIGLGIMGKPMAKNIMKAGYELVVNTHRQETIDEFKALGAEGAKNGAEVATKADVIITMLPNSPQVREVCLGKGGIIETGTDKTVVIDMSSIDPTESKAIAAELAKKGIDMLDCPVSGGEPKAIDGTLSVMCGGKKETWDKYYDLLMTMAGSVVYVGPIGSGNVAKLANQMIVASNIGAVAEALTFAKKAGTDPELVYKAIRGGLAGSTVLDAKAPMMLEGNYKPGFRIDLHIKDLNNALNAAHAINMPVPMTAHMMEVMQELKNHGEGSCDHDDIVKYYERMTGTSIVKDKQ
ncbi:MAG: 2-hydroxy-3-oxopropionate reductase [Lachnospiraceae bacterium]